MNYFIALLPAICFGLLGPSVAAIGGTLRQQLLGQMTGGFVVALIATAFITPTFTFPTAICSITTGLLCAWGVTLQLHSFSIIGVSRTIPISTGLQLALTALAGVLIFGEWNNYISLLTGTLAIGVIVGGIMLTSYAEQTDDEVASSLQENTLNADKYGVNVGSKAIRKGLIINFISAIMLSGYVVLMRASGQTFDQFVLPQGFGFLLGALIFAVITGIEVGRTGLKSSLGKSDIAITNADVFGRNEPLLTRKTFFQIGPGLLFGTGVVLMQTANRLVGVATGFTLSQMGVIIATLGGIYVLKEHKTERELKAVFIGVGLVVLGAVLIGFAKAAEM